MDKQMIEEMAGCKDCYDNLGHCPSQDNKEICPCYKNAVENYKQGYRKIPENAVVLTMDKYEYKEKKIYRNGEHIGYIDFSVYIDIRALGIGDFEIIDKRKGYGTAVINDIVDKYKTAYDLIYCFVDKENHGAIEFYKKVGDICYDKINDKGQYQVILYENETKKVRKETAEKFAERVKMAFYYEFDELIPSIMADKIDEICKELTDGEKEISNETV